MAQVTLKHPIVMLLQAQTAGGPPMMHLSSLCSLYSPCTCDIIVVINLCFSFSADIPGLVLRCLLSPLSCLLSGAGNQSRMSPVMMTQDSYVQHLLFNNAT